MFLKTNRRLKVIASAVLSAAFFGSAAAYADFFDDFSKYSGKADIEAFYGIEYGGGATAANWDFDVVDHKITFNLTASQKIYFYVHGTVNNDGVVATKIGPDSYEGNQGQFNYLGTQVTNADGSYVAWTACWSGNQGRTDYWHTGLVDNDGKDTSGMLYAAANEVGFHVGDNAWTHVTDVYWNFWNANPENPITFDNVATNRLGFFASSFEGLTGSILSFYVGGTVTSPIPEPATLSLLAGSLALLAWRKTR